MQFVVFSDDWGRRPSAPQHLFAVLARRHEVLWVEPAGLRRPRLTASDARRSLAKLRGFGPGTAAAVEDPWLPQPPSLRRLVPPVVPAYGVAPIRLLNDAAMTRAVNNATASLGFDRPVVVSTIPTMAGVVGKLGESCAIYWRVDDFSLWPGYDAPAVREREAALLTSVDALLASAPALLAEGPTVREILPHGVDVGHFSSVPRTPTTAAPRAMVAGRLDARIDYALLGGLLDRRLDLELELVGDDLSVPSALWAHPRVHRTPHVPYPELPAALARADVLLLPYIGGAWTDSLAPLKVREYIATGVPVVSAPLPGVIEDDEVSALVHIAGDLDSLVGAVGAALSEDASFGAARIAATREMSWEARAATVEELIALLPSRAV